MYLERRRCYTYLVIIGFCLSYKTVVALEIQPGVGVGVEYTDNATLAPDDEISDLITTAYVGASMAENEGRLIYNVTTSINQKSYIRDSYEDQTYFNLVANADWEMMRDRFNWILSDNFTQRRINSLDADTPDNIEDSNLFTFGANIEWPISGRQYFSLRPLFSQYYFEHSDTDNKQYSIMAGWNYQMFRLTSVGINLRAREIDYIERDFGNTIFTTATIVIAGERVSSHFSASLGGTKVTTDTSEGSSGYIGSANLLMDLSSRSQLNTLLSTDITDTSSVSHSEIGNPNDVELSTDVVRNSVIRIAYLREDETLQSSIFAEHRKLTYSSGKNDRIVRSFGVQLNYPVTQLLSGGVYVTFNRTTQLDSSRQDKNFTFGSNIKYRLTAKLLSTFDVRYRTKESTDALQNYDEFSVFASLVYGFGFVSR